MALFEENKKRMASARAIKDTVIIVLLDFALKEITNKHPEILEKIKNIIENRKEENKKIM
jgi:CRP-like cAMP-binding protein